MASLDDDDPDAAAVEAGAAASALTRADATPIDPLPAEAPVDVDPLVARIHAEPFTVYDADALWDWCRSDPEGIRAFFGLVPDYAAQLHDRLSKITDAEARGTALLRTVWDDRTRIGFVLLFPISPTPSGPLARTHCYLSPEARGALTTYLPTMLDLAAVHAPDVTLSVITDRPELGRLLQPFGFMQQIVLTRLPGATTETPHGDDRR